MYQRKKPLKHNWIKSYAFQLLAGLNFLHAHRIIHRDIKPENILISKEGILKIADFGMARYFNMPMRPYTRGVVTLWYKAPELILGGFYELSIDIWSVGCILYEMVTDSPLFRGDGQIDQLMKIFKVLGTPSQQECPEFAAYIKKELRIEIPEFPGSDIPAMMSGSDPLLIDLVLRMLKYDPTKRISAREALNHPFFDDIPNEMKQICIGSVSC